MIPKFIQQKRNLIHKIVRQHGAKKICLFGSLSRGEGRENSDIDFLVTMQEGSSLLDIIAIKQDLEALLGRKVDVVTEGSLSPYIRKEIIREAVNL